MRFKNLEEKPEREKPKRTIFASSEIELLQMVSELDTGGVPARMLGHQGG